ncbi:cytochrome-c peroxidase [Altericroceibacterium spongiae]|uniref:Cytochrome-c peroxidase n=1 Tax=Altericroceibacterium spongiae TaxID=2320269 RepID=A0A420EFC8_9SPHN|nr:cytochrome c peroxidase [Altericroceibacterium spongiae]RKF19364.1 cytochrome-c peroxidase [Altericroceibacterium spongiae]
MPQAARLLFAFACALFLLAAAGKEHNDADIEWLRAAYGGPVASWPAPQLEPGAAFQEFGPLPRPGQATGPDARRVALGEKLFKDPRLSASGQIACESCHNRRLGWGDGLPVSFGHNRQTGTRNAQSLFTAAYMEELFWDGRSPSLEDQAHLPIANPIEMAAQAALVEERINADPDYRTAFARAYRVRTVTMAEITAAIAAFERSIRLPRSTWDRALSQGTQALDDEELWGLHLFRTKAGCANCHSGPLFSDRKYHNLGISFYGRKREDVGRFAVTGKPLDVGRFRTPSLRGVSRTGPYMHNGIFPHLRGLVNLYAAGGGKDRSAQSETTRAPPPLPDPLLRERELSPDERDAIVAFLKTL